MTDALLKIENLQVSFATDQGTVAAVQGVSLEVQPGEVLAIVGESGSGKTVTARSILRMLPETATTRGAIWLKGQDVLQLEIDKVRDLRGRDAAMVFQEPATALNPVYTVGWQIAEGILAHQKVTKKQARLQAIEILRRVGIPEPEQRVDFYPHQFSGGQKQRVVIACALVLQPSLIIADEPTTALDVTVQAEILDLLRECQRDLGAAIVLITHNMGVVADLADRVAVMFQGKLVEHAPVHELFASAKHPYTKALLAAVPRVGAASVATSKAAVLAESRSDSKPTVLAKDLQIQYPGRLGKPGFMAVKGVSFEIKPGEVLGLVGESGSGKTAIGRAMVGLTRSTGGSLNVLGFEMLNYKPRQFRTVASEIGFVFQDPASSFNPLLTIGECIAEPMLVHGIAKSVEQARKHVTELLDAVQLPAAYFDRFPHELSGGQRQRASLARALALKPKLVIADEPTSALDVSVQAKVLKLFAELQEQFGFASLFITHDLAVVDQIAHRLMVLYQGEIVESGVTRDVLTNPQNDYTKRLLASLPIADPVLQRARRESNRK